MKIKVKGSKSVCGPKPPKRAKTEKYNSNLFFFSIDKIKALCYNIYAFCGCGGIGRRAGFRFQ